MRAELQANQAITLIKQHMETCSEGQRRQTLDLSEIKNSMRKLWDELARLRSEIASMGQETSNNDLEDVKHEAEKWSKLQWWIIGVLVAIVGALLGIVWDTRNAVDFQSNVHIEEGHHR